MTTVLRSVTLVLVNDETSAPGKQRLHHYASGKITQMTNEKQVFNTQVDLDYYTQRWNPEDPEVQKYIEEKYAARLIKFIWLDLSTKSPDDDEFTNVGVRDEQNTGTALDDMENSVRVDGWLKEYFPGIVFSDLKLKEARTRALTLMRLGVRYMPVALCSPLTEGKLGEINTGIKGNYHPVQRRVVQEDFIVAGCTGIDSGDLNRNKADIERWLYEDLSIEKIYPNNAGGSITKIVNAIYARSEGDVAKIVRKKSREDWLEWLSTCSDMKDEKGNRIDPSIQLDNEPDFALYKPGMTNTARFIRTLLENGAVGRHTYVVFYDDTQRSRETLKKEFLDMQSDIESAHSNIFNYAQKSLNLKGMNICEMDNKVQFTVLGAVPLMMDGNGHEKAYAAHRLIPLDQF